ncbi:MAG: hypothetical protein GY719_15640 [bacterium]|nr:hypothetical protein [bacterium]
MSDSDRAGIRFRLVFSVALPALLGAAAAWGGGATPFGTQPGLNYELIAPFDCRFCHGDYDLEADIEPWNTWAGSMMANSTRDPLFWAALDVANNDVPGVGDFCLRCHSPTGWLGGRSEPPGGSVDGCGLLGNLDEAGNDFDGISCHFCHRMEVNDNPPPGEQPVYYENGSFWIDDGDCTAMSTGPCRYGPYDYGVGDVPPPHEWAFSQYLVDSDICGNCHNVTSPLLNLIDENGMDTGIPFPIERTFMEWQQSDYAGAARADGHGASSVQGCQSCHMPQASEDPAFACAFQDNDRTGDMATHQLVGGNVWIPTVLRGEYPALMRDEEYSATIAWATDMLQNRTATVEIVDSSEPTPGEDLDVTVRVTNLTGHKLPTGYPEGRRMWLHATARDAEGDLLWESGGYDFDTGDLTQDAQVKIYEIKPGIWDLNGTGECDTSDGAANPLFHFVLNNCIASDNRIPPLGFTGGSDPETAPVAYTYPETSPGSGILVSYDDTDYQIPVPADAVLPITIEARLYFQTVSKEYVEFLRDEAVTGGFPDDCIPRTTGLPGMSRGELLHDMWQRYDRSAPVDVASDFLTFQGDVLEIPALSVLGLILLGSLLAGVGLARLRRTRG